MCTIMSISEKVYTKYKSDYDKQIHADSLDNPHGFALLIAKSAEYTLVRGFNTEIITPILHSGFDRFWLHQRYATSDQINIDTCHGFSAGNGRYLMHNGILSRGRDLPVDSMLIAELIRCTDPEKAFNLLNTDEPYNNSFCIDTYNHVYTVNRAQSGLLYTDGKGNYSTRPCGVITELVPAYTTVTHKTATYQKIDDTYADLYDTSNTYGYIYAVEDIEKFKKQGYAKFANLPKAKQTLLKSIYGKRIQKMYDEYV